MAASPMREAMMRSMAVGEPPRLDMAENRHAGIELRELLLHPLANPIAPPEAGFSATSTIAEFLLLRKPWSISAPSWSTSVSISGMMAASAPEAIAPLRAR